VAGGGALVVRSADREGRWGDDDVLGKRVVRQSGARVGPGFRSGSEVG
jgi:hypothetical protein